MLRIERSNPRDVERLCHFDPMARRDAARRVMLMSWARQGQVEIGLVGDSIVGFAVLTHSFFHQPFIELLMIGETYRRQGYGRALVEHCVAAVPVAFGAVMAESAEHVDAHFFRRGETRVAFEKLQ